MRRMTWILVVALAGVLVFVVGGLLDPESVPVARAVELTGPAPEPGPPPEPGPSARGYFVVPPQVFDFREDDDGFRNDDDNAVIPVDDDADDDDYGVDDDDADDPGDDGVDDDPDDLDEEDDGIDDDD